MIFRIEFEVEVIEDMTDDQIMEEVLKIDREGFKVDGETISIDEIEEADEEVNED